ncbi:hypothetical protein [Endozoicomonas acroporae]|uniref:hypothetical protein n=1 Tax=Endozoicomonas acroporae TaxID=1701104 RepID=UPI003D7BB5E9
MANNITQEAAIKWALGRLQNERDNLTNDFASAKDDRQSSRLARDIAQLSLRIQRIEQHLEDFEDLKHYKESKEAF